MELNLYSKILYKDCKIPTTGDNSNFSLAIWKCNILNALLFFLQGVFFECLSKILCMCINFACQYQVCTFSFDEFFYDFKFTSLKKGNKELQCLNFQTKNQSNQTDTVTDNNQSQRQITLRIVGNHFSSRLTAIFVRFISNFLCMCSNSMASAHVILK